MTLDIIRRLTPQIMEIAQKHGISHVYVFGSVARGENTLRSDVDFLVELQEGSSLFGVAGFGYDVEKLLGIPIDVVSMSTLPQERDRKFVANVQREAISL